MCAYYLGVLWHVCILFVFPLSHFPCRCGLVRVGRSFRFLLVGWLVARSTEKRSSASVMSGHIKRKQVRERSFSFVPWLRHSLLFFFLIFILLLLDTISSSSVCLCVPFAIMQTATHR